MNYLNLQLFISQKENNSIKFPLLLLLASSGAIQTCSAHVRSFITILLLESQIFKEAINIIKGCNHDSFKFYSYVIGLHHLFVLWERFCYFWSTFIVM